MDKTITSVENMVDKLLIISDRVRTPETSWNKAQNYNETALSPELFRKLQVTSVNVMTNPEMIEAFPEGLISSQFILINPNTIKDSIIHNEDMPFDEALTKEEKLKKFITDLLEESLTKKQTDDNNLIKLVSIYDSKQSKTMDKLSFKGEQFKNIMEYVKNDGDIMSLPGLNEVTQELSKKVFEELLEEPSKGKYPKNLLKAEQYIKKVNKEMADFLQVYESAPSSILKEYITGGFVLKIVPEMKEFRHSVQLKTWEFIAEGSNLNGFTKTHLNSKIRENIAKSANLLLDNTERKLLINGISSFSLIENISVPFSNIPDFYKPQKIDRNPKGKTPF